LAARRAADSGPEQTPGEEAGGAKVRRRRAQIQLAQERGDR